MNYISYYKLKQYGSRRFKEKSVHFPGCYLILHKSASSGETECASVTIDQNNNLMLY